jgi:hypothetical protein
MSLASIAFKSGATLPLTGGTSDPIGSVSGIDKRTLLFTDDPSLQEQRSVELSVKRPSVSANSPDGYTQARRQLVLKSPLEVATDVFSVNTVRCEFATSVVSTATDIDALRLYIATAIMSTEADEFFNSLSTD